MGYGELQDDHRPPEEIWLDDEAVRDHFDRVKEGLRSRSSDGGDWEDIPDVQNELTKGIRKGR